MFQQSNSQIECTHCYETGFAFLVEPDSRATILMRCICEKGRAAQTKYIPQWSKELLGVFEKMLFPVKSFRPGILDSDSDQQIHEKFWTKVENWKAKIQLSEDYWKYQIERNRKGELK